MNQKARWHFCRLCGHYPYMEVALDQLRQQGHQVNTEDVAKLSPLLHEHINLLGRYSFSVPDSVSNGQLRPLRDPLVDE